MPRSDDGPPAKPGAMPKPSQDAVARFRAIVPDDPRVSLRPMFGSLAAFANGYMFAGLVGDAMFVRLDDDGQAAVLAAGGGPFEPMPGRPMRGHVVLPDGASRDDAAGRGYVGRSLKHTLAMPPKEAKQKKSRAR